VRIGSGFERLVDEGEQRPAVSLPENIFHVRSERHLNLGITLVELHQSQMEFPGEGFLCHLPEDRFPDCRIHFLSRMRYCLLLFRVVYRDGLLDDETIGAVGHARRV